MTISSHIIIFSEFIVFLLLFYFNFKFNFGLLFQRLEGNMKLLLVFALVGAAFAEIYLEETFQDGDKWEDRWIQSTHKGGDAGKFVLTAGKFYGDAEKDKGIQTSQDAKFYGLSTEFKPVSNK